MLFQRVPCRTALSFLPLLLLVSSGCAAGSRVTGGLVSGQGKNPQLDVDPSRAFLPLSRIEPVPSKPHPRTPGFKPLSARASRQIGKAHKLVAEQRYTEAAIELERALRYDPNHPAIHRALAVLHWDAGNLERAKTHVARALEGNPDDAVAHYIKGRCHALEGDNAAAIAAFRTALLCSDVERDVQTAALCHYHLARTLATEGYLEASLHEYGVFQKQAAKLPAAGAPAELAALLPPNLGQVSRATSQILERLGRFAEAAEALKPLVASSPDDVDLGVRYGGLLARAGRLKEALAAARAIASDDDPVIELLFTIHKAAGHGERILEDLRLRLAEHPDKPPLVLSLADMLVRLGRADDARLELEGYLRQHGDGHTLRLRLADLHILQSAWEGALRVCAEGIERYPEHTGDYEARIKALAANEEASRRLIRAKISDEPAGGLYLRGVLAAAAGRWKEAESFLNRCLAQEPGLIIAREALARLYLQTYRYDQALEVAGRPAEETPEDARLERVLGEVYERLDDLGPAELHFKASTRLDRRDTQSMLLLAKLYNRSGRRLQARRQLQVLLEKDPDHEAARELLAFTYLQEGKIDVVIEQLEELIKRATTPITKARCKAFVDQIRRRDVESYREALLEAIKRYKPDAATWMAVAKTYDADREAEKTYEAYKEALALDADDEEAALELVSAAQRLLEFEDAAKRLSALLPRRPNRHAWRLGLIDLYWSLQDYDAALSLARSGAQRDDLDDRWRRRYRLAIVDTLRQAGRTQEILPELKRWAEAEPDDPQWSTLLAREYLRQDQPAEAVAIYETLHRADPAAQDARLNLVGALVSAGRYDRASQYLLDWLDDDPENDNALSRLVRVLAQAKHYDDALELAGNRLLRTFARQEYQDLTIGVLAGAERFDECVELIEGLIDKVLGLLQSPQDAQDDAGDAPPTAEELTRRPNDPLTLAGLHERLQALRSTLAGVLIMSKDYRAARRRLSSWLEAARDPNERFEYLRRLAFCHRQEGDESRATELLARALLLRPGEITLNNDVAYGWIDRGVRLDEAEPMIRYALSQSPRNAAYLDTYGWLQYKKGDFVEARKWLLRAARREGDLVVLDHLGDALWRLGESKEAIQRWREAVEIAARLDEKELNTQDERRVRDETPQKIKDAGAGRTPAVAPRASE